MHAVIDSSELLDCCLGHVFDVFLDTYIGRDGQESQVSIVGEFATFFERSDIRFLAINQHDTVDSCFGKGESDLLSDAGRGLVIVDMSDCDKEEDRRTYASDQRDASIEFSAC